MIAISFLFWFAGNKALGCGVYDPEDCEKENVDCLDCFNQSHSCKFELINKCDCKFKVEIDLLCGQECDQDGTVEEFWCPGPGGTSSCEFNHLIFDVPCDCDDEKIEVTVKGEEDEVTLTNYPQDCETDVAPAPNQFDGTDCPDGLIKFTDDCEIICDHC